MQPLTTHPHLLGMMYKFEINETYHIFSQTKKFHRRCCHSAVKWYRYRNGSVPQICHTTRKYTAASKHAARTSLEKGWIVFRVEDYYVSLLEVAVAPRVAGCI